MCTVVIDVPATAAGTTRVLAVRDEDPGRPWDPPGAWWPEHPGLVGVRDRRANGAWLAAAPADGRLSVILNRPEGVGPGPLASRGGLVLADVAGEEPSDPPGTAAFNLVSVRGSRAVVTSWDGAGLRRSALPAGAHMLAHHDVDDPRTARIRRWLPEFSAASRAEGPDADAAPAGDAQPAGLGPWAERWLAVLARSAGLGPHDDRAIVRDNRPHGVPTLSLLVCLAEVRDGRVVLAWGALAEPGRWDAPRLVAA